MFSVYMYVCIYMLLSSLQAVFQLIQQCLSHHQRKTKNFTVVQSITLDESPVLQSMLESKGVGPNTGDKMPHLQD